MHTRKNGNNKLQLFHNQSTSVNANIYNIKKKKIKNKGKVFV